jgi:hypothetical protein
LLSDAEGRDDGLRRDRNAQLLEHLPRMSSHQATIDDAESVSGKSAEENILFRRKAWSERQFLMDDDDAGCERFARRTKPAAFAVDDELAVVRLINPAQDLYKRRLARAILPDDCVHFARQDIEVNAIENAVADERFANSHRTKQRPEAFAEFSRSFGHS